MARLGIIITTFLRDSLLENCIKSISRYQSEDEFFVFIGDQNPNHIKELNYNYTPNCIYVPQAFDMGLSASRNELINIANSFKCDYIVVSADSIHFNESYRFDMIIDAMKAKNVDRVGFSLQNRIPWEFNLELISNKCFHLDVSKEQHIIKYNDILLKKVDICKNFFIATTTSLLDVPWDNELKLLEHEDWTWRYKQAKYKTYFTDFISANYINEKSSQYNEYRNRMYSEFKSKLMKKYNLTSWISYSDRAKEIIKEYKKCI